MFFDIDINNQIIFTKIIRINFVIYIKFFSRCNINFDFYFNYVKFFLKYIQN